MADDKTMSNIDRIRRAEGEFRYVQKQAFELLQEMTEIHARRVAELGARTQGDYRLIHKSLVDAGVIGADDPFPWQDPNFDFVWEEDGDE